MSVRKAMQLNYIMRRLACAGIGTEAGEKIRNQLAKKNLNGDWIPSRGRQTIWNGATLFLNLAIITLVLGYAWMIVGAAHRVGWEWAEDDTKVRIFPPQFTTQIQLIWCAPSNRSQWCC